MTKNTKEFFRETGELAIHIPALPRPTLKELQAVSNCFDPKIEFIERDTSPTKAVTLKLATVLGPYARKLIDGEKYERRIAPKLDIVLGYQQGVWLHGHQCEFPELASLREKIVIYFSGLVVRDIRGCRQCPISYGALRGNGWVFFLDLCPYNYTPRSRIAISGNPVPTSNRRGGFTL